VAASKSPAVVQFVFWNAVDRQTLAVNDAQGYPVQVSTGAPAKARPSLTFAVLYITATGDIAFMSMDRIQESYFSSFLHSLRDDASAFASGLLKEAPPIRIE
jgi:hypothetical protein